MPKDNKALNSQEPAPTASPIGAKRDPAAETANGVAFSSLSEAEWQAILSSRKDWPSSFDLRSEIELIGRSYWKAENIRAIWVKRLPGKQPAKQRRKIERALLLMRQARGATAELLKDGLFDDGSFGPDGISRQEHLLEDWLSDYDVWVRPFAGKSNPIQTDLEAELMRLWTRSGGKLRYKRLKDDVGTPDGPLISFLMLSIKTILGRAPGPSGIAKMIDRHRGRPQPDPSYYLSCVRQYL
jgi:hypothetical protein